MVLSILGNNSALPTHGRFPTAQVLAMHRELMLIDCGEGTQIRFQRNNIKSSKIEKIFISHLHGDHYFGLIGLLTSYSLNNRTQPIDLYGPPLLIDIINLQLSAAKTQLCYPLHFHPLTGDAETVLIDNDYYKISSFPTDHRITCYGFRFEEKAPRYKIDIAKVEALQIPHTALGDIAKGRVWTDEHGKTYTNSELTLLPQPNKVYCYSADTRYYEQMIPYIQDCDILYHETTYLSEHQDLAIARFHSTTVDAAKIATLARAKKLVIGHFSSKYKDLEVFLHECQETFPDTAIAEEGSIFEV